jgi:hypothetical protein
MILTAPVRGPFVWRSVPPRHALPPGHLIGRERERDALREALRLLKAGEAPVVEVDG